MECKPSSVYTMNLDGDAQLVGLPEGPARVVHPNHGEHGTQEDDEDVPQHRVPGHHVPPAKSYKTIKNVQCPCHFARNFIRETSNKKDKNLVVRAV